MRRRRGVMLFAVLLVSVAAFGEEKGATRLSVFASNLSITSTDSSGTDVGGGIGVALSHYFAPSFSLEMAYGMDKTVQSEYSIEGDFFRRTTVRAYPLDLMAAWHPQTTSSWKPYIGFGARYVKTPAIVPSQHFNQLYGQIAAGTMYNVTEKLGIRFDAKYIPLGDAPPWSEGLKLGAGVSWKF